jgi:phospholipase/carboxylesterase
VSPSLAEWPHVMRASADGASHYFLALHGTGGNETEIATLAQHLDPTAGVLSPRGRVSEHGMTRWFARIAEGVFDVDDVIVRAQELAAFIQEAREQYGIADAPITAVGFSNGANIATATALLHPGVLDRVVAFSGMYPFGDRDPIGDVSGVELVLLNGAADPMAPAASVEQLARIAESHGASVERHIRAGGHGIDMSDVTAARQWLAAR